MRVDDIPGVHVTPCERDPFPSGRALMGPEGSQDLVRQLAEMTVRFRASQAATTRLTAETGVVLERARSTRRRSVDVRATVRLAHAERVAA
jgi:hypothetical protein